MNFIFFKVITLAALFISCSTVDDNNNVTTEDCEIPEHYKLSSEKLIEPFYEMILAINDSTDVACEKEAMIWQKWHDYYEELDLYKYGFDRLNCLYYTYECNDKGNRTKPILSINDFGHNDIGIPSDCEEVFTLTNDYHCQFEYGGAYLRPDGEQRIGDYIGIFIIGKEDRINFFIYKYYTH